ncbi:hypothetical protein NUU61_006196 [Penicillium alfredii]|uniref:BZIP domain-containing protein n=1 Tax=Penicillium alfredii TaxID=1506179 RepID=A0A9W9F0N0_9EURO|nr:uncharacterized protein NUU61_006196 [Penicillium alfredii]KAJ5091326.1 hypothetical protein NUU61_006196 [Penicillium alfredii]
MLNTLPQAPAGGSMIANGAAFFVRENWAKEAGLGAHRLVPSLRAKRAMASKDMRPLQKRESRSGTRKVSSLSAEQLERKRANDREAQRSIRQRTKEHIEQLEIQVSSLQGQIADLRPRSDRFDEIIQRNAVLEDEVDRLKHQLTSLARPGFAGAGEQVAAGSHRGGWGMEEAPNSTAIPTTGTMLSPHFTSTAHATPTVPRSASSRSPHPADWQEQYSTRSPSLGAASDPESFSNHMDSYVIDGQLQQGGRIVPSSLSVPGPQISFSATTSPTQDSPDSAFSQYLPSHCSMPASMPGSMPSVTAAHLPTAVYQASAPSYQHPMAHSPQGDQAYPYQWVSQT